MVSLQKITAGYCNPVLRNVFTDLDPIFLDFHFSKDEVKFKQKGSSRNMFKYILNV